MEAGESIDSAGASSAAANPPDQSISKSGLESGEPQPADTSDNTHQNRTSGFDTSEDRPSPDLTIMDGIPSLDTSNLVSFLPAATAQDKTGEHEPSLEEQIQAFTAGLANQLRPSSAEPQHTPRQDSIVNSPYDTPTQANGTPATAEDIASFETLIASLMPTPQPGSPAPPPTQDVLAQSASQSIPDAATQTASITSESEPSSTSADSAAQNFVDKLLREANLFPQESVKQQQHEFTISNGVQDASIPTATTETEPKASSVGDDALTASLEQFMASLQARVSSSLATEAATDTDAAKAKQAEESTVKSKPSPQKQPKVVKKPKKVLGKRKYREIGPMERRSRVEKALSEYIASIDTLTKPNSVTGPIPAADPSKTKMTTIRCSHASVAQKSYGSEKRFFNPPPIISITGPLRRYAEHGAATLLTPLSSEDPEEDQCRVSLVVRGDTDEYFSNENVAVLDGRLETKMRSLYVTPTGRSKSFRLQLNLLRPSGLEPHLPIFSPLKKSRAADALSPAMSIGSPANEPIENGSEVLSRLPKELAWASFESAPVTIISKSSKKTAKPRGELNQVKNGSMISLYNRINSQTARTKYMRSSNGGDLTVHNGDWSTYRITLISRPPLAELAGAEADSVTYGSTIVLTDVNTGFSSDPLVVCKVDKGQVQLPQLDPPSVLLKAGTGNKSRRVPIDPALRDKLATVSKSVSHANPSTSLGAGASTSNHIEKPGSSVQSAIKIDGGETAVSSAPTGATSTSANVGSETKEKDDLNLFGPVGQMQKVALMRFVPSNDSETVFGDSEHLESNFSTPRSYLCGMVPGGWMHISPEKVGQQSLAVAFAQTHEEALGVGQLPAHTSDKHHTGETNSVVYATPKTVAVPKENAPGIKLVDEVDDAFVWTVIGVSRFEYSYFDTSATQASKDEGPCEVPMTPFPLITSMPIYDQTRHTLVTTVTNFIVPAAITSDPIPLDVWAGSLGPLKVSHSTNAPSTSTSTSTSTDPETYITVTLPAIREMIKVALTARRSSPTSAPIPPHVLLPLIFVNDSDGTAYHSGRHIVCEDLVQLMKATGHDTTADVLKQLGFGLGDLAGPPNDGAWSVRII